jgi:archaellum component FlaC
MDAIHYDKIADKLINFHSKLPKIADLELQSAKNEVNSIKELIERLLHEIDVMADVDSKGWLR